jgi:hypothetical protein
MNRYKLTESASDDLREIVAYLLSMPEKKPHYRSKLNSSKSSIRLLLTPFRDIVART